MACPPTKRLRGLDRDVVAAVAVDDPFGDDVEFTQDDLDEIDIIASQAITSGAGGAGSKPGLKRSSPVFAPALASTGGQSKPRAVAGKSREHTLGFSRGERQQQHFESDREESYRLLEVQHAELKRKLKEVEEEILLKSGEIRVLRDSLRTAQQEKDVQKHNQVLLDTQRREEQSEREKELNRKVQSLQSELQFKEAEINEMKTKLVSSDKSKTASPPVPNRSKIINSLTEVHHGSGTNSCSPVGNGFPTKEAFGPQASGRTPVKWRRDADGKVSGSRSSDRCDPARSDPFLSIKSARLQHRGALLLGSLLQEPLSPGGLGLSHLLAMSTTGSSPPPDGLQHRSVALLPTRTDEPTITSPAPNLAQSLATMGLNMLSQSRAGAPGSSRNNRSCPGAVLLLPLLDQHLTQLCLALPSPSSSASTSSSDSVASNSRPAERLLSDPAGQHPGLSAMTIEEAGFTALKLLRVLLTHSDEVVEAVLLKENSCADKAVCASSRLTLCSQNALLHSLLHLCDSGSHREELVHGAMETLCVLSDRSPREHSHRLQIVLQRLSSCLSADSRLQTVSRCVSVLTSLSDHQTLAERLCSQHDPCVFLKLFHFIRTRPDSQATLTDWVLLDLQVIRLLSGLAQRAERWMADDQSSCPCYAEHVQTVVIILHRQWLDLRGSQQPTDSAGVSSSPRCPGPASSLLRECVLQLHWLLLHHARFSESCRPLLHMYDQMIPAVRDTLKKIPELGESEELALEDICRSEGDDDADDMDMDTGP